MRAITISGPGGPEVLTVTDLDDPTPGPHEVVIQVAAAGVNRADLAQRMGFYPPPEGAPDWPGLEVSGSITAIGDAVKSAAIGDQVVALLTGGGYAEQVVVDEGLVLPLPGGVDLVTAAGLPEAVATVWSNVFLDGRLQPGESLLVHGGTSGVGHLAIQLAVARGATVYATAGSAEKTDLCEHLGAARAINYREQDFVAEIQQATGGRGVDVVLDLVGGSYVPRDVQALAPNGRVMIIANQDRGEAVLDVGLLMRKRATLRGTTLRSRPLEERRGVMAAVREHAWPLLAGGDVNVIIDNTYPLERAAAAHQRMETGHHAGKIILTTRPGR